MEKINIAEVLKNCPKGMELDCTMYEDVFFDYVDELNIIHCYIQHETHKTSITFNQHGTPNSDIKSKCVIFPKGKTTWEGFQIPFKDGDILADEHGNIAIYKGTMWYNKKLVDYYCGYRKSDNKFLIKTEKDGHFGFIEELHYASEEEKQKLFDVIKDNDYKWDVENKTLEKLIVPKFKDGDVIFKNNFIAIISYIESSGRIWYHCWYHTKYKECKIKTNCGIGCINDGDEIRFATEEEKEKLFLSIKENGYKWNAETKTLENLIKPKFKVGDRIRSRKDACDVNISNVIITEVSKYGYNCIIADTTNKAYISFKHQDYYELIPNKFDINTLKPFDEVLVRLTNNCVWMPKFFSYYDNDPKVKYYPFVTIDNIGYPQCIPYNGNEHLRRTTNNCDEFYRVWEE